MPDEYFRCCFHQWCHWCFDVCLHFSGLSSGSQDWWWNDFLCNLCLPHLSELLNCSRCCQHRDTPDPLSNLTIYTVCTVVINVSVPLFFLPCYPFFSFFTQLAISRRMPQYEPGPAVGFFLSKGNFVAWLRVQCWVSLKCLKAILILTVIMVTGTVVEWVYSSNMVSLFILLLFFRNSYLYLHHHPKFGHGAKSVKTIWRQILFMLDYSFIRIQTQTCFCILW